MEVATPPIVHQGFKAVSPPVMTEPASSTASCNNHVFIIYYHNTMNNLIYQMYYAIRQLNFNPLQLHSYTVGS